MKGAFRLDPNVIDALVFYFMLAIHLTSKGVPESEATITLRSYIEDNRRNGEFSDPERYAKYLEVAYHKIPSSFLKAHDIPVTLGDGIRVIDLQTSWIPKL